MATVSFTEDLQVRDSKKTIEILEKLKGPKDASVRPAQPDKLPGNAKEIWFSRSKK